MLSNTAATTLTAAVVQNKSTPADQSDLNIQARSGKTKSNIVSVKLRHVLVKLINDGQKTRSILYVFIASALAVNLIWLIRTVCQTTPHK